MSELPAGTVSFLFTDVEESTNLLKQLGERYGDALLEHRRLLREAFAERGGREVDTQGDAFFYAFPRARDAVRAAIDGQRALGGYRWPADTTLRVRMGVHTSEPLGTGEGYVGLGLTLGARICSAAHGGQILLSRTTAALVADESIPGARVVPLGEYHVKGIDEAQPIYQAIAEGLAAEFPPLRAIDERGSAHHRRGILTLLFTNIFASTGLLRHLGRERFASLLDRYHAILREVVAEHRGRELDAVSDSFLAVFETAKDAVAAADAVREALASEDWQAGTTPSVTISVHSGQLEPVGGRYVGLAIHRTVQLNRASQSGQVGRPADVLISETTQKLLEDEELGDVNLVACGEIELSGFDEPVRVYELSRADG